VSIAGVVLVGVDQLLDASTPISRRLVGAAGTSVGLRVFNQVTTAYFVLAVFGTFGIIFSVSRAIFEVVREQA
jgi:hypothetical protein